MLWWSEPKWDMSSMFFIWIRTSTCFLRISRWQHTAYALCDDKKIHVYHILSKTSHIYHILIRSGKNEKAYIVHFIHIDPRRDPTDFNQFPFGQERRMSRAAATLHDGASMSALELFSLRPDNLMMISCPWGTWWTNGGNLNKQRLVTRRPGPFCGKPQKDSLETDENP